MITRVSVTEQYTYPIPLPATSLSTDGTQMGVIWVAISYRYMGSIWAFRQT